MKERKIGKLLWTLILILFLYGGNSLNVYASLSDNPYVSFSPDGEAYTVEEGRSDTVWYSLGKRVYTGVKSNQSSPQTGEHLYNFEVEGLIPIEMWQVNHRPAKCIHLHDKNTITWHGLLLLRNPCRKAYFSGWVPYCADCGAQAGQALYYMSMEAAESMEYIDVSKDYYYKCPHCNNLEQAIPQNTHICKRVSKNRYYVRYNPNQGSGYMANSVHMYDNAELYEGREVTPQTTLSLNTYTRSGFVFVGWNTKADGSGLSFEDGGEVWNLTALENEEVTLYAQWAKCPSILRIEPAGGLLYESSDALERAGVYGEVYLTPKSLLIPPEGYTVHFDAGGGEPVADIQGERIFKEWKQSLPFYGELSGGNYTYSAKEGITDCIAAVYSECPITLPHPNRQGYSFGGWYLDKECTKLVGMPGDEFTPGKETTLYAGWVELQLLATDNYVANEGKGAVDLRWSQSDSADKLYLIYQKTEDGSWTQISSARKENITYETDVSVSYSGTQSEYTVPYTGFYRLTLYGAQGGNYAGYKGGYGGVAEASVFLQKGEKLQCVLGGQNGYGGGGSGNKYAGGGGASSVFHEKYGVLLVAGGGGGADGYQNGLPGGTFVGVLTVAEGESGSSGGGGGYQGGCAGEVIIHEHQEECIHEHVGNSSEPGGCYTKPVPCKGKEFNKRETGRVFYYGNISDTGAHIFCLRCGSYECPGHLDIKYGYECKNCKTIYDYAVTECSQICAYDIDCDMGLLCEWEQGQILSCRAACGGSNYINKEYCLNYREEAGVREENGMLQITAEITGLVQENSMQGIYATDLTPPDAVLESSITKVAIGETQIRVSFTKPKDNGTAYYHKVESYDMRTNQKLCTSNQTKNILISGVVGYFYQVDNNPDTVADANDIFCGESAENPFLIIGLDDAVQYLHIAPVDKAGNVGETVHIRIGKDDITYWPLITEKIQIEDSENVKAATQTDTYYVKADGVTSFEIECKGMVCGSANSRYQITHSNILAKTVSEDDEGLFCVITPMKDTIGDGVTTYPMRELLKRTEGKLCVADGGYTVIKRYNYCKNIELIQQLTIEEQYDGQIIQLTPQVGVQTETDMLYSDRTADALNSIYLIADAKGPVVRGIEALEDITHVDFSQGEEKTVSISAEDEGSGLAQFYVEIYNPESNTKVRYEDEQLTGKISFAISEEEMVFMGEFQILVVAVDYVGNETVSGVRLLGVGLQAYVQRILEPHDTEFKRGESGVLCIQTTGYVERVEVIFPEALLKEGESGEIIYIYENPDYLQMEQKEFIIPFTAEDGLQNIQVKAYKSGTQLEEHPQLITIEVKGSILDELRTRLR